jgi:hypothetical protein
MIFSDDTMQLLNQVNNVYPGSIVLRGGDEASGVLLADQVSTDILGTRLMIEVSDATAPDFSASHELLSMLLKLSGYPQLYFQLDASEESLTEQLMVMSTYLYRPVLNAIIYREQGKHELLTDGVVAAYAKGVLQTLTKEVSGDQSEGALRLLTLLDARVLMHYVSGDTQKYKDTLADTFPEAWQAAGVLFDQLAIESIDDPASLHRGVVAAFNGFDAQMIAWGLPELHAAEFATLTPVLSERQLRLTVSQVFEIKHAVYKNHSNGEEAYIGLAKNDGQNSFVIVPPTDAQPAWFKELYQTSVKELLDAMNQPYIVRS